MWAVRKMGTFNEQKNQSFRFGFSSSVLETGITSFVGLSHPNILRMKIHPFQVCLFYSSSFYSNKFEKALETKKPKLSLWFFFICTRDGT